MKLGLFVALVGLFPWPSWSMDDWKATPQEREMCGVMTMTRANALGVTRKSAQDPNWATLNHYCDCLRFYNRALGARIKTNKGFFIQESIQGCDYVLEHTTEDFRFRPEMHYRKGLAYELKGDQISAAREFMLALQGNPALPEVYQSLGDIYLQRKEKTKALELYTEGLRYAPNSKALQRRYFELGGKEPLPHAITSEAEKMPPVADEKPTKPPISAAPTPAAPTQPAPPAKHSTQPPSQPIGSPTNPWCRFCPETEQTRDPATSKPQAAPTAVP
jgi:hypothetical protein